MKFHTSAGIKPTSSNQGNALTTNYTIKVGNYNGLKIQVSLKETWKLRIHRNLETKDSPKAGSKEKCTLSLLWPSYDVTLSDMINVFWQKH